MYFLGDGDNFEELRKLLGVTVAKTLVLDINVLVPRLFANVARFLKIILIMIVPKNKIT